MELHEEQLYELLYETDEAELLQFLQETSDSGLLHMIAANYNWDNGFAVPLQIASHAFCDLGTALMIFELAGGYDLLLYGSESQMCGISEQEAAQLHSLMERIEAGGFVHQNYRYAPELDRMTKYRLKKAHPTLAAVFTEGTDGEEPEVVLI